MKPTIRLLLLVLHFILIMSVPYAQSEGEFTQEPHDATRVQGQNATFQCAYSPSGDLFDPFSWTFELSNGTILDSIHSGHPNRLKELGVTITHNGNGNSEMILLASAKTNGTIVHCRTENFYGSIFFSTPGSLMVLGPPSAPEPVLTAINNTLLNVSWPPPFTWPNHSITHYNITLTNTSDDSVQSWTSNETWFYVYGQEMERGCDVLVVNVTASSDIGESESGSISGGFPIAPEQIELRECDECKVTFLNDGTPMYAVSFKLPHVCSYQTNTYQVWLYGHSISSEPVEIARNEYTSEDITNPVTLFLEAVGLMINHTYGIDVIVYNSEGNVSTNTTFSTEFVLPPIFDREKPVITVTNNDPVIIGGIVIGAIVLIAVLTVILVIVYLYKRKRRSAIAELTRIFMEDRQVSGLGGPYTHEPENRVYESVEGFQEENFKKFDLGPACPPRKTPSLPPPRDGYITGGLQIPQIMVNDENKNGSNPYLQIISDNGKCDPEVRSTGSGEYTTMKSVSLQKEQISAVNALATQTPQGFNEDNYMVFMEQGESCSKC